MTRRYKLKSNPRSTKNAQGKTKNTLKNKSNLLPFLLFGGIGAAVSVLSGADSSFDTLNYHLFNGWATFRGTEVDYLPTSIWTFFPSHLDFLYYIFWAKIPSVFLAILVGGFQGLLGFVVYKIVVLFEDKGSKLSTRGIFFGILALSTPLIRAQLGNSMHDGTLVVLELYIIYKLLQFRILTKKNFPKSVPVLIGLVAALKPAHIVFVLLATLLTVLIVRVRREIFEILSVSFITFILFSLPWWYKSFKVTGTPFFPYLDIGENELLSGGSILRSYSDWEIRSLWSFIKHLIFPGGSPFLNHEIPFVDFTIPITLLLTLTFYTLKTQNKLKDVEMETSISIGNILFVFGIMIYMLNQIVFTGVRYSLVTYPIAISVLGIWSISKDSTIRNILKFSIPFLVTLNLLLPNSIYLPHRSDPIFSSNVPDYGRTSQSFVKPVRSGFTPSYPISEKDYVLLGQEQISFVAAMWNQESHFMGLQAYILGNEAKHEMRARLATTTARGGSIYIVALTQNLETMKNQLEQVSQKYRIMECKIVNNPFKRDISMCKVI